MRVFSFSFVLDLFGYIRDFKIFTFLGSIRFCKKIFGFLRGNKSLLLVWDILHRVCFFYFDMKLLIP